MFMFRFLAILSAVSYHVTGSGSPWPADVQLQNAAIIASRDSLELLHRSLSAAVMKKDSLKFSKSLDTSWENVPLFSIGIGGESASGKAVSGANVEVVCTNCYIKGLATASIDIAENFNISRGFNNVTDQIEREFGNFTSNVRDYVQTYVLNVVGPDVDLPPIDVDFDIDIPNIPECKLQLQFDGLELYMQIDTTFSAASTYTINLYSSNTPVGIKIGNDLMLGIVLTLDLILDVQAQIDISSGFHIRLDKSLLIDVPMFSRETSSITLDGGDFEFLPVTIESAGIVFTAVLRVGLAAGLELSSFGVGPMDVHTGIESGVWFDIAQLKSNITAESAARDGDRALRVVNEYTMGVGANAGAILEIGNHTWGPVLESGIPVYTTTLDEICVARKTSTTTTPSNTVAARQNVKTVTSKTEVIYTATMCIEAGLLNCPSSLQTIMKTKVTSTLTATVSSGDTAVFTNAAAKADANISAIPFGTDAHKLVATAGSPVSYTAPPTPTPPPTTEANNPDGGKDGAVDTVVGGKTRSVNKQAIIGGSVGGSVFILAVIGGLLYWFKFRPARTQPYASPAYVDEVETRFHVGDGASANKKAPQVDLVEYQRVSN